MAISQPKDKPIQYGVLLFPQFEVLDAAGPLEALNVLSVYLMDKDIKLSVISKSMDAVNPGSISPDNTTQQFAGQQLYQPTHTYETAPVLDVLIVPGGRGTVNQSEEDHQKMLNFIRKTYEGTDGKPPLKYAFSICTGASLFAQAGILDGHKATINKKAWPRDTPKGPKTHWIARARWVTSGNIWTTSGVTAGLDGMLAFIASIYGDETADKVTDIIEHKRTKSPDDDPFADLNGCEDVLPKA